uniref:Transcription factor E2F7 n=1 Tax=Lepisosteus oculatus TaxID=7918 RepID=W5NHH4_LEPOC|nr:PREDICTED: transcription factor E2F7 isoform X1 [Lepisosteus oculatus]
MEKVECLSLKDLVSPRKTKLDIINEDESKIEQKENIYVECKKITPFKDETTSAVVLGRKGYTPERIHCTPNKLVDRPQTEPWTPTANLKMLISAASPDIRDREMRKSLFRPIENETEEVVDDSNQFDITDDCTPEDFEKQRPSRKLKSLGLLCQKFLALYPDYPLSAEKTNISLDEVAVSLGVERRRIYDIVNVLESLLLVSRVAKNQYCWHGRHHLRQTLEALQSVGRQQNYEGQMAQIREKDLVPAEPQSKKCAPELSEDGSDSDIGCGSASRRKDKSLRIMSQKFVMLFLVSRTRIVTLDVAAKILIEESQDAANHSKYKTKVRRLYDIANVLTSLGLIKKVHVKEERGRKPAFKWIGPTEFRTSSGDAEVVAVAEALPSVRPELLTSQPALTGPGKQRLTRHASFSSVPASRSQQRKISSAPSSPQREQNALTPEPVDYSQKRAAVCKLQFGENLKTQHYGESKASSPQNSSASHRPAFSQMVIPIAVDSQYGSLPKPHAQSAFSLPHPELLLPRFFPSTAQGCQPVLSVSSGTPRDEREPQSQNSLVYFQNMPPAPLVMLYGNGVSEEVDRNRTASEGQRSPVASNSSQPLSMGRKRLSEDEGPLAKRGNLSFSRAEAFSEKSLRGNAQVSKSSLKTGDLKAVPSMQPQEGQWCSLRTEETQPGPPQSPPSEAGEAGKHNPLDFAPHSHYLYVPNSAGLNGLNFLLSAGPSSGGLALSPNGLPTLALPYVVVPSSTLPPYSLMANSLPAGAGTHMHNKGPVSFNVPAMVSPARFVVGPTSVPVPSSSAYSPPQEGQVPSSGRSSPEQPRPVSTVSVDSPAGPGQLSAMPNLQPHVNQPQTPLTPKETHMAYLKAFFQTPGTTGSTLSSVARKRGERGRTRAGSSVQRRLDIGNSMAK